jgi:NitT/TauT family transport system substrate-binding protein
MRICTIQWPGYEPLYLARSLGHFAAAPVELLEYPSTSDCLRAFGAGAIDAVALTLDETLRLLEAEIPLKVVLVMDFSNGADAIVARTEVQTLADLKGRRVGVENTALGAYMLTRALQGVGFQPVDVQVVPLSPNEHESAFLAGAVDAVVTFDPVRTRLLTNGAHQLFSSKEIPGEILDVLVVQRDYATRYPERVQTLLTHWYTTLAYLKTNPHDAARGMSPRLKLSPEQTLQSLDRLHFPSQEENRALLSGTSPPLLTTARQLMETMLAARLLQQQVPVESLL